VHYILLQEDSLSLPEYYSFRISELAFAGFRGKLYSFMFEKYCIQHL